MEGKDVYLVHYKRSAFSRSRPNDPDRDVFNSIRMDQALSELIRDSVTTTGINPAEIDDVIVGSAYQRDENWTYGGRHPVFLSNLPVSVPSMAVDRACASSLNAVSVGSMEISSGVSDLVIAGGIEHMTHIPRLSNKLCTPLIDDPKYSDYRMKEAYSMGLTAENLANLSGIGRTEMDEFSLKSHMLASEATKSGFLKGEILPLKVSVRGEETTISTDQSIRGDSSMEALGKLSPVFKEGGMVTAGNSSPLNAGASMVMLASEKTVRKYGLAPLAKIKTFAWAGVEPYLMGLGPIPASRKLLERNNLDVDDIDVWEINEAFAVVVLNAMKELGIKPERVNMHGGAIAIGHPLGASGIRLLGTASRILNESGGKRAIATLCAGGGQGFSALLERT